MSWIEAAARWYAFLIVITWALAPAVAWLCLGLADRGATVTRPIALLLALYPAWLLASLGAIQFGSEAVWASLLLGGAACWTFALRRRLVSGDWIQRLIVGEAASVALFAAYIWLRGYTPQILGTEKPMDLAFLASTARAIAMPPPDPWFAGQPINYYYLGYLLHGTVARLSGVRPEIAFNLALATIFSTTIVSAFGVGWNVVRPSLGSRAGLFSGAIAAFLLALAGNLYAPQRLLADAPGTISAWWWDSVTGIGWRSSRIVCDGARVNNRCLPPATETINEFPFFSFLLGDLHPHVMALPYTLVAIALAWNLARRLAPEESVWDWTWATRVGVIGALLGALYPLNAWDYPTYLLLAAFGLWIATRASVGRAWRSIAILVVASVVAWLPFLATYVPPLNPGSSPLPAAIARLPVVSTLASTFALHVGERTSLGEYLIIFGIPFAFGVALVMSTALSEAPSERALLLRTFAIAAAGTIVLAALISAPVVPICGIPCAIAVHLLRKTPAPCPRTFALGLFAVAWALSIGVELVYVRDVFNSRMNTLFKFYFQAWTLYALAAAVTIPILWSTAAARSPRRAALAAATLAMLLFGSAYPIVASVQWTEGFQTWRGLDGIAYAEETDPDDLAAIRWLAQHAAPNDVVLEAAGCSYRPFDRLPFNRVSAVSGIPTVIGWEGHERQWRGGQPELIAQVGPRQTDVAAMYADPQSDLFHRYGVTWLFVGEYESGDWRAECKTVGPYDGPGSPGYPGPGWDQAFATGDTRIYRRQSP